MPHPVRVKAQGRPTFTLGVMNWADDVSGNRSKQYNPHTNVYSANLHIPHQKLQQEFFIHFSSTSPTAGALEQLDGFVTETGPDVWHEAYDCLLQREILFRLINQVDPADNPQQSELCSHIGLHGNKFCRRCHVGGNAKEVESEAGYESLFSVSFLYTSVAMNTPLTYDRSERCELRKKLSKKSRISLSPLPVEIRRTLSRCRRTVESRIR